MSFLTEKSDRPDERPRFKRAALIVSLLFHIGLIAALAAWYVNLRGQRKSEPAARVPESESESAPTRPNPPRPAPDVTSEQVNNTLERMQQEFEEKPAEEQLDLLEEKAAELEKLASEESIDEIAARFQEWTNIQPRASAPAAKPVEGEFDFDTGQLHEVRKVDAEDGTEQYVGVLVDADGRALEVEMGREEGETAYRTMEALKRFPLADRVYRQIGMALIDQAAAASSASTPSQAEADDRDPFDGQLDDEPAISEEPDGGAAAAGVDAP